MLPIALRINFCLWPISSWVGHCLPLYCHTLPTILPFCLCISSILAFWLFLKQANFCPPRFSVNIELDYCLAYAHSASSQSGWNILSHSLTMTSAMSLALVNGMLADIRETKTWYVFAAWGLPPCSFCHCLKNFSWMVPKWGEIWVKAELSVLQGCRANPSELTYELD